MKAAFWYGRKDVRIEEVEEPKVRPGYAKIKIKCCGICGGDLHEYVAGPIFMMKEPHPLTGVKPPVIMGHESAGDVIEVGPDVKRINTGDRVAISGLIVCGECYFCKQGDYNLCNLLAANGFHGISGGYAQYAIAPEYQLYKIPENLSYESGACCDPISVGLHAMSQGEMIAGKKVGIFGAGPIGLSTLQVARVSGASFIAASEISQTRRNFAKKFGANLILNPAKDNVVQTILENTDGLGLDIAFECAGVEPSMLDSINSTRKGGTVVVLSLFEKRASLDMVGLLVKQMRIVFSFTFKYDFHFPVAMALMSDGRISGEEMITKKISLTNLVDEGFEELLNNSDKHIKIMVYPD